MSLGIELALVINPYSLEHSHWPGYPFPVRVFNNQIAKKSISSAIYGNRLKRDKVYLDGNCLDVYWDYSHEIRAKANTAVRGIMMNDDSGYQVTFAGPVLILPSKANKENIGWPELRNLAFQKTIFCETNH